MKNGELQEKIDTLEALLKREMRARSKERMATWLFTLPLFAASAIFGAGITYAAKGNWPIFAVALVAFFETVGILFSIATHEARKKEKAALESHGRAVTR